MQPPENMGDFPQLCVSENEEMEDEYVEEELENVYREETVMRESAKSLPPNLHEHRHKDAFPCRHCKRHFSSRQGLERHMHVHDFTNKAHKHKSSKSGMSFCTDLGQSQQKQRKLVQSVGPAAQHHPSSHSSAETSALSTGGLAAQPDKSGTSKGRRACKCCEKTFCKCAKKRHCESNVHEQRLKRKHLETKPLPREETGQKTIGTTSRQESERDDATTAKAGPQNEAQKGGQYMLDVSSDVSENLSFYIDGKIVSTSTVSGCEAADVHPGSSALAGLDSLVFDAAQISQLLNADSVAGKEITGQPAARRRTATPPLLPQIKTELESEVVVSSSASSLVSSLLESVFPQNAESTVVQKERTVFLSPKLTQLLEKQDGLQPTLALITDGQKACSSVLPAVTGAFKRRTGSPSGSPRPNLIEEAEAADSGDGGPASTGPMDHQTDLRSSPVHTAADEKGDAPSVVGPAMNPVSTESRSPVIGGNSCNQQPLDLSNTVKKNDVALADGDVLDLSLQRKCLDNFVLTSDLISHAVLNEGISKTCVAENSLLSGYNSINISEQNLSLGNGPLVTDFTIVTGTDMVTPVEPVAEGLVYGLALPSSSLTPSPASLTPVALQPASPCTIAFTSPHTMLPAPSSLITVFAPPIPPPLSSTSSQPIQVLAPNLSQEPLVICTENTLNSPECDLTAAFSATNPANLVTLSQPFDPTVNLPGHVFLTDQIALSTPIVESAPGSEMAFAPTVTLNDSLINSYNIASNAVLIECTIALEAPGSVVPSAITLQENTAEPPAPEQMVVNHIEQQQIVSVPNPQTVEPTLLVSSIAESLTLSTNTPSMPGSPTGGASSPGPESVVSAEPPAAKEEDADSSVPTPEISAKTSACCEKAQEESSNEAPSEAPQQQQQQTTFTKNFVCNVCDKLFHSMKELGHHVGDHADEWPYKCEFCVLLFGKPAALLDHRSSLHGVGKTYVCSACAKDFVYLCNLKQHQEELHPGQQCTYAEEEKGKLRPQNFNNSTKVTPDHSVPKALEKPTKSVKKEEAEVDTAAEELLTTIKIMASDGGKLKGPDVRLGINQLYPSFKPPPFLYHNRSPAGTVASATNFTTHNIPQTFSTALRCTKCGNSFDNLPELHKHILACANASDKRRYTPKKNPVPLRHFAKAQNGVLATTNSANGQNEAPRGSQSNKTKASQESIDKITLKVLKTRKKKLIHRVMPPRNKSVPSSNKVPTAQREERREPFVCPHCSREFTLRRSRTKHMMVCPDKPGEAKKRKEAGVSLTKENNGHLHRGVSNPDEKRQISPRHKTRWQASSAAKRPAVLPGQTVFSTKRSKIVIKECTQSNQPVPAFNELPIVCTFNSSVRQYGRVQHNVKEMPIKITIVKPQKTDAQKDDLPPTRRGDAAAGSVTSGSNQSGSA